MKISHLDFTTGKVFVYGDVMIDHYWNGDTSRISPEAPVPVVLHNSSYSTLGGASNVARNIVALNGTATISGLVGNDSTAQDLINLCAKDGINTHLIPIPDMQTTLKIRVLSRHQQLLRVDFENAAQVNFAVNEIWRQVKDKYEDEIKMTNVVVLSDYLKGARSLFPQIIALANKYNKPVIVDPKGTDYSCYKNASLLTPNLSEFKQIASQYQNFTFEQIASSEYEPTIAKTIIADLNLSGILITKSDKGMTLYLRDGRIYNQLTYAEDVYDVTGAGDTVIATLAASLANNIDIIEACYLANRAAGISVAKLGTSTVSIDELTAAIGIAEENEQGYSLTALKNKVISAKKQGKKIVFTNGCFDILHRGHLTYLKRAKELGDYLIVAVNSDDSVKRLKGEQRPINTAADRMLMLSSLKFVDWVVEFNEDTPLKLITQLQPDVLVKGGDYKVESIVGYNEVIANGGSVQVINFVDNYSSTNIIEKIKKLN